MLATRYTVTHLVSGARGRGAPELRGRMARWCAASSAPVRQRSIVRVGPDRARSPWPRSKGTSRGGRRCRRCASWPSGTRPRRSRRSSPRWSSTATRSGSSAGRSTPSGGHARPAAEEDQTPTPGSAHPGEVRVPCHARWWLGRSAGGAVPGGMPIPGRARQGPQSHRRARSLPSGWHHGTISVVSMLGVS